MRFLFAFLLLCFAFVPDANALKPSENRTYKHFQKLDKKGGFDTVYEFLRSEGRDKYLSELEDITSYGVWLRDMHFKPEKDLRYGFLYAAHMKEISEEYSKKGLTPIAKEYKGTASLAYFISLLKMNNSISRCNDNNAGVKAKINWAPKSSDYKKLFLTISPAKRKGFFDVIVGHAEKSVNSESADWVCLDGISVMNRAIQAGEESRKVKDPEGLGRNYEIIDTSKYVEFISDDIWKSKRNENIVKLKTYLLGGK